MGFVSFDRALDSEIGILSKAFYEDCSSIGRF